MCVLGWGWGNPRQIDFNAFVVSLTWKVQVWNERTESFCMKSCLFLKVVEKMENNLEKLEKFELH